MEIGVDFFARNTLEVAPDLLGKEMRHKGCSGIIVETEAYRDDPASHAVRKSGKATLLSETYGHIYVYRIYGMHVCLNFTAEKDGVGAVLIRAVEPLGGVDIMKERRRTKDLRQLTNGPGKLCQAFNIDMSLFGEPVGGSLKLFHSIQPSRIERTRRIGISRAKDLEWRFVIKY